ncbi:MAG TPA: LuxR C-terminal-related transcriptional regulator [Anaerolineales bacterium]|nr:LuxR C-terminal-related transcriptional regulator [Anaerolineales bacterium]
MKCYNFEDMTNPDTNELSERELDILKLVATGASNKEIARKLFISSNTVKVHLRNIFTKIGVTSRTEAAMHAVRIGLVEHIASQGMTDEKGEQQFQGDISADLTYPAGASEPQRKIKSFVKYLGVFGGIILILLVLGLIYDPWNILPANSSIPPTPTPRVQWFQLSGLPTPRWGLAVVSYDNLIYAIGGENESGISNRVERYDSKSQEWIDFAIKPTAVSDISAAAIGGLIYVPGGKSTNGLPVDVNEIYDPLTNKWSVGAHLPKPLCRYALAVNEGRMYLFGGWDGKQVVNDAYVYDPDNDQWSQITAMPTARSYAGAVTGGGKIYVIGGWDGNQALTNNEVFHPDYTGPSSPWSQGTALPSGRYGMGIANLADIIFIVGGTGVGDIIPAIALSSGDQRWGQVESPLQNNWAFLGAATVGTRLFVLGGKTGESPNVQMWSYQVIFTITLPIVR